MAITTSYTDARQHLADLLDRAVDDREIVRITRRGHGDVILIAADEIEGLLETVYLFRSPRNAERLLQALDEALQGRAKEQKVDDLRREMGLEQDDGAH